MKKLVIMSTVALASSFMIMPSYGRSIIPFGVHGTCTAVKDDNDRSKQVQVEALTAQITVLALLGEQGDDSFCAKPKDGDFDNGFDELPGKTEDYYLKLSDVYVIGTPIEDGTTKTCDLAEKGTVTVAHTNQKCGGKKCDANLDPLSTDGKFMYKKEGRVADLDYGVYYKSGATFQLCNIKGECLGKSVTMRTDGQKQIGITTQAPTGNPKLYEPIIRCGAESKAIKDVYILNQATSTKPKP